MPLSADSDVPERKRPDVLREAIMLYGLIHARFLVTARGLALLESKYRRSEFQSCPMLECSHRYCLPVGLTDAPNEHSVHYFCPSCQHVYRPEDPNVRLLDGAYFGTSAAHILLLLAPSYGKRPDNHARYGPKIFGFVVHKDERKLKEIATRSERRRSQYGDAPHRTKKRRVSLIVAHHVSATMTDGQRQT